MRAAVLYGPESLNKITELQDHLCNSLEAYHSVWDLEIKLHRANPASFRETAREGALLYTVCTSEHADRVYVLSDQGAAVFDRTFVAVLQSKMQSLWQERQTFLGHGQCFRLQQATVRLANVFVQSNFKGLLVQIEVDEEHAEPLAYARELAERFQLGAVERLLHSDVEVVQAYAQVR